MNKIKQGNIVGRKSYNKDIIFIVQKIIDTQEGKTAILKGITERIEADSKLEDLEIITKEEIKNSIGNLDKKLKEEINKKIDNQKEIKEEIGLLYKNKRHNEEFITGKILHLDGDRKYSEKSYRYYKKLGLNAVVKNIPENRQPKVVYNLLTYYNPDILIITGHDGMIRKGTRYNDFYNYRNSRHFVNTVTEARRYERENNKNLVIFAGACQSYFEALIAAGANFASSPSRILIDFLDPLIIAERVATTDREKYITINDIEKELRDGKKGVNGIGAYGKRRRKNTL